MMSGDVVQRTVTVTGTASADVRPDRATLSLGVQARRSSAQGAMGRAADRADHVVNALRDAGATDADLRTSGLNLWYDQSAGHYVATYSMTVSADLEHLGRYLDGAALAGADEFVLNGVSFSVSDRDTVVAPLRELALADARAKAIALAAAEGDTVAIAVRDSGVGMDDEALARVFEPYFSTKTSGTGLGLPIARRNVELSGGTIDVTSGKGDGTTVRVRLPVAETAAGPVSGSGAANTPGR